MASLKVAVGTFLKKKFNTAGISTKEEIPFLPKTLARLVYMDDGKDINTALKEMKTGEAAPGTKSFNSMEEYEAALAAGTANRDSIYVINDSENSNTKD